MKLYYGWKSVSSSGDGKWLFKTTRKMTSKEREGKKVKIQVKNITKRFGELLVLDNVSFSVYENEFLCICGPTGCGKTTLLNIIAGLIPATNSRPILIDGKPINLQKHNISFVFQEPSCFPWKTVQDNIKFSLEIKKTVLKQNITQNEIDEKVKKIIDLVDLNGFEDYYPHQISGGMKQRIAIAQAFVTEPDLLLMDEPFGYLDVQTRYYMEKEVLRIWEKLKRTVIFVTHSIEEAVYLAERIVVLTELPASVKAVVSVDLPRPRERTDPEFVKIRRHITELIKWW